MTLGERLKQYRTERGLSQEQLAEELCVSRQAITKWENNTGLPDIANLITISRLLNLSLDELVMGEECIREKAVKERENKAIFHQVAAVCFFVAAVCWIISACISWESFDPAATVLLFITAAIAFAAGLFQLWLYRSQKEQGR